MTERHGFILIADFHGTEFADVESFDENIDRVQDYATEWRTGEKSYAICPATLSWQDDRIEEQAAEVTAGESADQAMLF